MANCEDCLHQCYMEATEEACNFFVDKTKYVEVVRCKDCKNAVNHPFMADSQKVVCTKSVNFRAVESGHYCSYGERREGE